MTSDSYPGRFLWNTLLSFYGHPAEINGVRKPERLDAETKAIWVKHFGEPTAKEMRREYAAARKDAGLYCQHCDKLEEEKGSFMICGRCRDNIDRKVLYCSR
jgi:hypothetical protein